MLKELAQLNKDLYNRNKKKSGHIVTSERDKTTDYPDSNYARTTHITQAPRESSREKENMQFMNTFQEMKDQMVQLVKDKHSGKHQVAGS